MMVREGCPALLSQQEDVGQLLLPDVAYSMGVSCLKFEGPAVIAAG